jgi:hypothetical protein
LWIIGRRGGSTGTDPGSVVKEVPGGNHHRHAKWLCSWSGFGHELEEIHKLNLLAGIFGAPLGAGVGLRDRNSGLRGGAGVHQAGVLEYSVVGVVITMDEQKNTGGSFNAFPRILRNGARNKMGVECFTSQVGDSKTHASTAGGMPYEELMGWGRLAIRAFEHLAAEPLLSKGL